MDKIQRYLKSKRVSLGPRSIWCSHHKEHFEAPGPHWSISQSSTRPPYYKCRIHSNKLRYQWKLDHKEHARKLSKAYGKISCGRIKNRYWSLKAHAKGKKAQLLITLKQFEKIVFLPCVYCKSPDLGISGFRLDRKDPLGPYSLRNVVPCCTKCNQIKHRHLSYIEMLIAMGAVLEYRKINTIK